MKAIGEEQWLPLQSEPSQAVGGCPFETALLFVRWREPGGADNLAKYSYILVACVRSQLWQGRTNEERSEETVNRVGRRRRIASIQWELFGTALVTTGDPEQLERSAGIWELPPTLKAILDGISFRWPLPCFIQFIEFAFSPETAATVSYPSEVTTAIRSILPYFGHSRPVLFARPFTCIYCDLSFF